MIDKIPIHFLHTQTFCEYQIFLEYVEGVKGKITTKMKNGKRLHEDLEKEHKQKAELKLKVDEAIEKARKEKIVLVSREVPVVGRQLMGLVDEIHFEPYKIIIIDDKPNNKPYLSNKKQVWGYCLAFQEMYKPQMTVVGALRHISTKEIIWREIFTEDQKKIVIEAVGRIQGILNKTKKAEPTSKIYKCRSCRFNASCPVFIDRR